MNNTSSPVFSVIIPCYNAVEWIAAGLQSLEEQTFRDFEVILVDDCSTDDTYRFLLSYQSASKLNIQILKNDQNCGPGGSRNNAIRVAKGEYLAFMDSDDWYEPDYLEQMYLKIQDTGAELVFCDFYRDFRNGRRQQLNITASYRQQMSKREYIALCYDSLCVLTVRKKIFEQLNIPLLYNAEDTAMVPLLVAQASKITYVSKPLYHYLYRTNSLSTRKNKNIARSFNEAYRFLRQAMPDEYRKEVVFRGIKMIMYGVVYNTIRSELRMSDVEDILKEFQADHPDWPDNPYLKILPGRKVFFIWCVKNRFYGILKVYCKVQEFLFQRN